MSSRSELNKDILHLSPKSLTSDQRAPAVNQRLTTIKASEAPDYAETSSIRSKNPLEAYLGYKKVPSELKFITLVKSSNHRSPL